MKYTLEEANILLSMFSLGNACGMYHPVECFMNYIGSFMNCMEYSKIPEAETRAANAFVKYLQSTSSHPNDPVEKLTVEGLSDYIDKFYQRKSK